MVVFFADRLKAWEFQEITPLVGNTEYTADPEGYAVICGFARTLLHHIKRQVERFADETEIPLTDKQKALCLANLSRTW